MDNSILRHLKELLYLYIEIKRVIDYYNVYQNIIPETRYSSIINLNVLGWSDFLMLLRRGFFLFHPQVYNPHDLYNIKGVFFASKISWCNVYKILHSLKPKRHLLYV